MVTRIPYSGFGGKRIGRYRCECGKEFTTFANNVKSGHTKSCGCLRNEATRLRSTTHGHKAGGKRSRTYVVWMNMKARCDNPTSRLYQRYGGRGITYDRAWSSFEAFLRDMGEVPQGQTIERKNNDEGYSRENCRWATRSQQAQNKSNVKLYEWNGERRCVADWARVTGIQRLTLRHRLKAGWPVWRALTEKPKYTAPIRIG